MNRALALGAALLGLSGAVAAAPPAWRWGPLPHGASAPTVPADNPMSAAKVELGRRLFYDRRLSGDSSMSCAACHDQKKGFTNGARIQFGVTGEPGIRNVPGLANVAWRSPLTWADPNVRTLEQQALVPMTGNHPVEMGSTAEGVVARLTADACYRTLFARAFPAGGITMAKVTAALASFERTLVSAATPWDRYRAGDSAALTPLARTGAEQFAKSGCAACHAGPDLTDDKPHYVGTTATAGVAYGEGPKPADEAADFRTPSLRNVAITGPWLHDGTAGTIEDAIRRHAAQHLAGVDMPALLAFLDAQTDAAFLRNPQFAEPAERCSAF